jgi:Predicted integral membrane protein (DUF2270)
MEAIRPSLRPSPLDAPTIGALAHLYRGEIYRSTIWRTRLDNTTNWAVVTLGIALSVTFSRSEASPLPLLLAGILCIVFLIFEARRYRYFNVWRARARWIERNFYAPMLRGETLMSNSEWSDVLANDYCAPRHHISFARAMGRRLRRNYIWILGIQTVVIAVCSDPKVLSKVKDMVILHQQDLDFPITDAGKVREFLAARKEGVKIVFSTYQSAHVVGEACQGLEDFDLGIFDEAHKTAGREGAKFGFGLEDRIWGISVSQSHARRWSRCARTVFRISRNG